MAWDIGFDQVSSSSSSSRSSSSSSSSSSSKSSSSSSKSSSSALGGTVVWGHHTAVDEDHDENFDLNWTETEWTASGSGDAEILSSGLGCDQVSTSQDWNLGPMEAIIRVDKYNTGSGPVPIIQYKTATTAVGLIAASWNTYNGTSFTSLGWIKLRIIHT